MTSSGPPTNKGLFATLLADGRSVLVELVIECDRCGTVSSSNRWKRMRCKKRKARVDSDSVRMQFRLYEMTGDERRRLSEDELAQGMHAWAVRSRSHGDEPCPECGRWGDE